MDCLSTSEPLPDEDGFGFTFDIRNSVGSVHDVVVLDTNNRIGALIEAAHRQGLYYTDLRDLGWRAELRNG